VCLSHVCLSLLCVYLSVHMSLCFSLTVYVSQCFLNITKKVVLKAEYYV